MLLSPPGQSPPEPTPTAGTPPRRGLGPPGAAPIQNLSKPSSASSTSLLSITIGTLVAIWSSVWYAVGRPETKAGSIVCLGLLLTGIALLVIGLAVGQIGRAARSAELPPKEAVGTVARADLTQAANGTAAPAPQQPMPASNIAST